jgi:DNA-directed RNA polymerase specialized sigma24 family protein
MQKMSVSINPEKNAVEIDRFDKSMEAMNSLPVATKQMLIMRSDGFSYEEIANDLEISVSNLKTSIFRGRKLLSKILNKHDEESGL